MKRESYRVYYRPNASAHYIDLGTQPVEIAGNDARIELNGQPTPCVVEDVERPAADRQLRAVHKVYLRRKEEER